MEIERLGDSNSIIPTLKIYIKKIQSADIILEQEVIQIPIPDNSEKIIL